jgi:hypothetical protein
MIQALMVGQLKKMISSPQKFARDFFENSTRYLQGNSEDKTIKFGYKAIKLQHHQSDAIGSLAVKAFIEDESGSPEFILQIWRSTEELDLPSLTWAHKFLSSDHLMDFSLTEPFRIAFDKSQKFIFVYDTLTKLGSIWIGPDQQISLNSFVTPFRLMLSWMAEDFDAEIVHASSVCFGDEGLLINGPSGSGKSTLALLCLLSGYPMMADDVVLVEGNSIFSIYKYAKVDSRKNPLDISRITTFKMNDSQESKVIIDLEQFGDKFIQQSRLSAVILPIFAHINHFERLSSADAIKLIAPNSLREIMGGSANNFKRLVKVANSVPVYRIALSTNNQRNMASLAELVGSL